MCSIIDLVLSAGAITIELKKSYNLTYVPGRPRASLPAPRLLTFITNRKLDRTVKEADKMRKMSGVIVMVAVVSVLVPMAYADYTIDPSVYVRDNKLSIRGRVSYGERCERLKVSLLVTNDKGYRMTHTVYVEDVGGSGSRLLDYDTRVSDYGNARWSVVVKGHSCQP